MYMKIRKIFFLIIISITITSNAIAQINLEHIVYPQSGIGDDFYLAQISDTETKYVLCDTNSNTFSLFNMDFSPFLLNVSVPEPFSNFTFQAIYISRSLFDCDTSNIEYVYESPTNNTKTFRIVRTDGTILFQKDSANGPFCLGSCLGFSDIIRPIRNTSNGTKLFLRSGVSGQSAILIYSLCGSLSNEVFSFQIQDQKILNIFPNPSNNIISFQFQILDNVIDYELVIYNYESKEIKRIKISKKQNRYDLDVTNFKSGFYFYSLIGESKSYQSGKFIISN
jgi:hypothetical protein